MPEATELLVAPAESIAEQFAPESFDAIVAEGFLGEPKEGEELESALEEELNRLSRHYASVLPVLHTLLRSGGCLVLALPAFVRQGGEALELPIDFAARSAGFTPRAFTHTRHLTAQGALRYGRPAQLVWRDIYRWEK